MSNDFRMLRYSSVVSFSGLVSAGVGDVSQSSRSESGGGIFFSTSIPTRRTHGYAPAALTDLALGLPFATPRPRFVAWNASVTFAGAMVLVPRVESATRTESSRSPDVNIFDDATIIVSQYRKGMTSSSLAGGLWSARSPLPGPLRRRATPSRRPDRSYPRIRVAFDRAESWPREPVTPPPSSMRR